ncbi:uncharacterized protein I206_103444 [Kwoniella pini CBS 10737]|uniref:PPM-type phosphatase domain-containing protein n=1 Tax=Kwoniella pini CBS 10737 TaxID=1296096 RepID=A0A1B9I9Y6_9TREE|nr:uncharacterized protein I206_01553 [Kwoniella pini CBS 10737]OCF52267.1 hypothetical protein I206_01553 [Kwoniella pini CBS 10737]
MSPVDLNLVELNEPESFPIKKTTQSDGNEAYMQILPGPLIKVWGLNGPLDSKNREWKGIFYIRPKEEIEDFIKQNARSFEIDSNNQKVRGWDEIVIPSNPICEDKHKIDIIPISSFVNLLQKGEKKDGSFWKEWYEAKKIIPVQTKSFTNSEKDMDNKAIDSDQLMFFSVFDGMGGSIFSDMISKTLHGCLALTLSKLKDKYEHNPIDKDVLTKNLIETYVALQEDFLNAAPSALKGLIHRENTSTILPALNPSSFLYGAIEGSGCTACSIIIDTQVNKMYIANVGDSRAVAGWWNQKEKKWRCDVLTEDQCGDNPKECQRRLARHPIEEAGKVIYDRGWGNRVLGTNDVVRKFGGSYSVRSHEEENEIWNVYQTKQAFNFFPKTTPPYTDTEPTIDIRDLNSNEEEELKFVILATDGVWERLTSEEAVLLVAAFKDNATQGDLSKIALAEKYPLIPPKEPRLFPVQDLPGTESRSEGSWTFEGDKDAGTHLIRNVLGGSDKEWRQQVLSLRDSAARQMRDDMTAM